MTSLNCSQNTVSTSGTYYYVIIASNSISNSSISNCENITISQGAIGGISNGEWIYFVIIPALIVIPMLLLYRRQKKKIKKKEKSPMIGIGKT